MNQIIPYRGRFAPSPTGELHLGSLVVALASYIEARQHKGTWLIRIEDIDQERCAPHYAQQILSTLNDFGLVSDEEVVYQSNRHEAYYEALTDLQRQNLAYPCVCSRRNRKINQKTDCPCIASPPQVDITTPWRLMSHQELISFTDQTGQHTRRLTHEDRIILYRREGYVSYDLAVCVDDEWSKITHVVRGADLFTHTFIQRYLQHKLGYHELFYRHVPLVLDTNGNKLSKQNHAQAVEANHSCLSEALRHLGLQEPERHFGYSVADSINNIIKDTDLFNIHEAN